MELGCIEASRTAFPRVEHARHSSDAVVVLDLMADREQRGAARPSLVAPLGVRRSAAAVRRWAASNARGHSTKSLLFTRPTIIIHNLKIVCQTYIDNSEKFMRKHSETVDKESASLHVEKTLPWNPSPSVAFTI